MTILVADSRRLLLVDDEESVRFSMAEYFSAIGYTVDTAASLDAALSLMRDATRCASPYRAVVADLRLDGSHDDSGLRLLEAVRRESPDTLRLLLTAYGRPEIEAALRQVDAVLLHKPVRLRDLATMLDPSRTRGASNT